MIMGIPGLKTFYLMQILLDRSDEEHPLNAKSPMHQRPGGTVTLRTPLRCLNALSPILVTPYGITTSASLPLYFTSSPDMI